MKFRVKMDCQKQELEDGKGKRKAEKKELFENVFLLLDECFGAVTREVLGAVSLSILQKAGCCPPTWPLAKGSCRSSWTRAKPRGRVSIW